MVSAFASECRTVLAQEKVYDKSNEITAIPKLQPCTIYDCTYHIVWVTKYRYKVLIGDIGRRTKYLVQEICKDNGVEIIRGKVAANHVHIYVSIPPYQSISKLVQYLKGKSSRKIQQEFPELKKRYWGRHLWAVGYFVRTTGNVTDQMIKAYIEKHEGKDEDIGDFQVEN